MNQEKNKEMKKKMIEWVIIIVLAMLIITIKKFIFNLNGFEECTKDCFEKMQQAEELMLKRKPGEGYKNYVVVVDGEIVGKMKGKVIRSFGNAMILYSPDKKEIWLQEKGRKKIPAEILNVKYDRKSDVMKKNEKVGVMYERIKLGKTAIELRDEKDKEKALLKGKMIKLTSGFVITDPKEKITFAEAKKRWNPLIEDTYDVTIYDSSVVSVEELVLLLGVADEENDEE